MKQAIIADLIAWATDWESIDKSPPFFPVIPNKKEFALLSAQTPRQTHNYC
jgi:hypothetical protein